MYNLCFSFKLVWLIFIIGIQSKVVFSFPFISLCPKFIIQNKAFDKLIGSEFTP